MDFEKCKKAFDEYWKTNEKKEKKPQWQYHHSYQTSEWMAELAFRLHLSKEEIMLAKIIGLLHGVEYRYLFEEGHIKDFLEERKYDNLLKDVIHYYNQHTLPKEMDKKTQLFTKMLRDMNRVDLYKAFAVYSELIFDEEKISDTALQMFRKRELLEKEKVNSLSDSILVSCSFLFDISFCETFDILSESDNFYFYLSMVDVDEKSEELWEEVKNICYDVIDHRTIKEG